MKKLCFLILMGGLIGCEYDDYIISEDYNDKAVYEGIFLRSSPTAKYMTSDVSITFEKNTFVGTSSVDKYPAICDGTFTINGNIIEFTNDCIWTADFDWTLILSGEWQIEGDSFGLTLTRNMGEITDRYELKRKP